jgi:hypothetical protein
VSLISVIELSFPWLQSDFYTIYLFIEFHFCILHCITYFIQMFIWILFELIQLFICIFFEFTQVCVSFLILVVTLIIFFEFITWDFIHFTIVTVICCGIVDFWRIHVTWFFSYYSCFYVDIYSSKAKFLVRRFNLLFLFSWSIHNFSSDWVASGLWCIFFLTLESLVRLTSQTFNHGAQDTGSDTLFFSGRRSWAAEAILVDRHPTWECSNTQ